MSHISEDILRRYIDEPTAMLSYEKEHLLGCNGCRARLEAVRSHATFAAGSLSVSDDVDLQSAHRSILAKASAPALSQPVDVSFPVRSLRRVQWIGALAAALLLFLLLGYSPLRGVAANFLAIFEPHQFQPIGISASDAANMKTLPSLSAFGSMHATGSHKFISYGSNFASVTKMTHQVILRPSYLPATVPNDVLYHTGPTHSMTFTFKSSKAHPEPATIAGSTITATIGPVVVQTYGEGAAAQRNPKLRGHGLHMRPGLDAMPENLLVISQAPTPQILSSKATVAEIEAWLVQQPGVPPSVVAQIKAIGDPSTTLPVPVQLDKQMSQSVRVQGVSGLMVGDNTGVGSMVMWQKDGMVYFVAGPYTQSEILQVANSLK